jgi:hypothetical protein
MMNRRDAYSTNDRKPIAAAAVVVAANVVVKVAAIFAA